MRKVLGVLVLLLGVASCILFFISASQLAESGDELTYLRSVGGSTVAEYYYQEIGRFGIAVSMSLYALGLGTLGLCLGLGARLLFKPPA
ncbi:MAG: hypothetical protein GF403_02235 [Candidatus Coatesbacteria bacterium]|jgi:hypothetical protein|nr:hypothetical protein [Candidatus Coatesbacteria bacterium]